MAAPVNRIAPPKKVVPPAEIAVEKVPTPTFSEPEAPTLGKKIGLNPALKLKSNTSINSLVKEQKSKDSEVISTFNPDTMPKMPFTIDELMAKWKRFCYELKEQGRENIFTALTKHDPTITGFAISLILENKVQEDYANSVKLDALDFLRKELNNYSISMDFVVEKSTAEKIAYTGREKFEKMAQTNPHIITLQQKLKLMIE